MESSLASWQFENFSTAELSPPISPGPSSPHSPSLYNQGGVSPNPIGKDVLKNPNGNEFFGGIRAPVANNLLHDLEQFEAMQFASQNDFASNWNEATVNLELFSELSDLDFVQPPTPAPASPDFASYQNQNQNLSHFIETASNASSYPPSPIQEPAAPVNEYSPEVFDKLSAEFQAILESLPPQTQIEGNHLNDNAFDDLVEISGIPAIPIQSPSYLNNLPIESNNYGGYSGMVFAMDEDSNNTNAGSIYYSSSESEAGSYSPNTLISDETMEENADAAEKILDALLSGNLPEAESYMPIVSTFPTGDNNTILISSPTSFSSPVQTIGGSANTIGNGILKKQQQQQSKPKSEGRRTKGRRGLSGIADKSLRKKEQNKTAATRYRLKKKMEAVVTTEVENTMQKANDVLQAESNDLAKQISIVKQLLRDIRSAKQMSRNSRRN